MQKGERETNSKLLSKRMQDTVTEKGSRGRKLN